MVVRIELLEFSVFSTQLVDPNNCRKQVQDKLSPANLKIESSKGHKTLNIKKCYNVLSIALNFHLAGFSLE